MKQKTVERLPRYSKDPLPNYVIHAPTPVKSKIGVNKELNSNPAYHSHLVAIQNMWDSLPEDIQKKIEFIQIEKGYSQSNLKEAVSYAFWKPNFGLIFIALHHKDSILWTIDKFSHEVGHTKWEMRKESHPQKIKQYIKDIIQIGGAPTSYAKTYLDDLTDLDEKHAMYTAGILPDKIDVKIVERYQNDRLVAESLFANEVHSETGNIIDGRFYEKGIIKYMITKDLDKFINAHNKLWDNDISPTATIHRVL